MADEFVLMTVSSGSPAVLSQFSGVGVPRLFEGDSLYVYRILSFLPVSRDGGLTWEEISPGATATIEGICQISGTGITNNTVIVSSGFASKTIKYQKSLTETKSGWISSGSFDKSAIVSESIAYDGSLPVIVGGYFSPGVQSKMSGFSAPYTFTSGGTGIPSFEIITDIEAAL